MQVDTPLLELKNIIFSYTENKENLNKKPLLEIEKLVLYPSDSVGIVGDNGSGKSTIVRIILGLQIPKGKVNLFGKKVLWRNHYPQLGYIGDPSFSPGETGLPTGVSVKNLLDSFKAICNVEKKESSDLEEGLGLDKIVNKSINNLSNGERKKLMIFLAISKKPKLLIADEATDGLDETSKTFVLEKLENLYQESKLSLLWISHQYYEVARLTNSVYKLIGGKLKSVNQEKFDCEIHTSPKNSICGKYSNLSSKGWLEIASKAYASPEIKTLRIKGTKTPSERE